LVRARRPKKRARAFVCRAADADEVPRIHATRFEMIREETRRVENAITQRPQLLEPLGEHRRLHRLIQKQRQRMLQRALDRAPRFREVRKKRDHIGPRSPRHVKPSRLDGLLEGFLEKFGHRPTGKDGHILIKEYPTALPFAILRTSPSTYSVSFA